MTTVAPPRTSLTVLIAAWSVPALVLGQFAFLAGIPIVMVLYRTWRDTVLRWWSGTLAAVYAILLGLWIAGPAPSLSKSLGPVEIAFFAAIGLAVAIALQVRRR